MRIKPKLLEEQIDFYTPAECKIYAQSLDCALAVYLETKDDTEKMEAALKIYDSVLEPGKFLTACLEQARKDLGKLPIGYTFDLLYLEKAKEIGLKILLETFEEGL